MATITTMTAQGRESAEAYHKAVKHWSKKPISQALDEQQNVKASSQKKLKCEYKYRYIFVRIENDETIVCSTKTKRDPKTFIYCGRHAFAW